MNKKIILPLILTAGIFLSSCATELNDTTVTEETTTSNETTISTDEQESIPEEYTSALATAEEKLTREITSQNSLYQDLILTEKYSKKAAQYAVDNINVDWKQNALEIALFHHLALGQSEEEIYGQLVSNPLKFSREEANYAIDNLQEAAELAGPNDYDDYELLKDGEGFTPEELKEAPIEGEIIEIE